MSKPGLCCDACYDLIAKRSEPAARIWLDLCEVQARGSIFGLKIDDNEYFLLLETLGFILTTDTKEYILFKVLGKGVDALGAFFCGGRCDR